MTPHPIRPALLSALLLAGALASAARAGGLRGETQLDLSISPAGLTNSNSTDVAASGNRVFVVWTETAVAPATTNEIYLSRSDDGGRSWSSPVPLSSTTDSVDDSNADVSADGDRVVVTWLHGASLTPQDVQAVASADGGATFGSIADVSGNLKGDAGDSDLLTVHVDGLNVYVSFEDDAANPTVSEDVYVASSTDGGATWGNPVRVNDTAAGTVDSDDLELKTTGSTAYLVWIDKRAGNDRVYFDRTLDGGATWGTDKLLDRSGALADADSPSMSVEGTSVHVVWTDDRSDVALADQVFYASSSDSGATFTLDKKLGSAPLGKDADSARVSASGSHVYALWADDRNGLNDLFIAVSADGGATFASEYAIDSDVGTIKDESPHLRSRGDSVFVLFREEIALVDQVWLAVSPDHGAPGTFATQKLSTTLGASFDADNEAFAVTHGRDVVGAWVDNRAGGTNNDVYVNGQHFPNLTAVQHGRNFAFQLSDASPSEEGQLFLAVFSLTGTNPFLLPNGVNLNLTLDSFSLILLQGWAIPLVSDTVQNGSATTLDLPLRSHGYAAAVVIDLQSLAVIAETDPVTFN